MMLMITALGNVCNEAVFSCHSVYSAVMQCHLQQLRFPMSLRDGDIVTLTKWHIFTCSEKTQICDTRIARSKIAKYIYQIYNTLWFKNWTHVIFSNYFKKYWHQLGRMQACTLLQTDNHVSTQRLKLFTGHMPFLPANQQCQSTQGNSAKGKLSINQNRLIL